jgi:hypothetical protein
MSVKEKEPITLHPNEIVLIASRATLGHTVSPEEYQGCVDTYSKLMAESINDPKKKMALQTQFARQQQFVKGAFKNV